jgi:hypothetical protein
MGKTGRVVTGLPKLHVPNLQPHAAKAPSRKHKKEDEKQIKTGQKVRTRG